MKKMQVRLLLLIGLLALTKSVYSQDPNFFIFLCFGQSNMEGFPGTIQEQDKIVDSRFQVMEAVTCSNLGRTKGTWDTATPPLCRCNTGLTPVDYFGRIMIANLPDSIRIGVINVAVAGCKIELFDKDHYQTYADTAPSWMKNIITEYGGNPYARLVDMAKLAQQDGVIKGILLHQGESNVNDSDWPTKVKTIYDNLMNDLELNPDSVPILAGEVVQGEPEDCCTGVNVLIGALPKTIPNSHVIPSNGCSDTTDHTHFNSAGYRELGRRYGLKMLLLLGQEPDLGNTETIYLESECATVGAKWMVNLDTLASNKSYVTIKAGLNSTSKAPTDSASSIYFPFTVTTDTTFYIYARVNCPTSNDDSYWIKTDDGSFIKIYGLVTNGWQWMKLMNLDLTAGEHTLTFAYRKDGAKLDKICISSFLFAPTEIGDTAENLCIPDTTAKVIPSAIDVTGGSDEYDLGQNYPNPLKYNTSIAFEIPNNTFVSLQVYNMFGSKIAELAGKAFSPGKHTVEFDAQNLPAGIYFYTMNAETFYASRKMILQGK